MKLFLARTLRQLACSGRRILPAAAIALAANSLFCQASGVPDTQPHGQVIYSRSTDENGQTKTTTGPAAKSAATSANEPVASDAERQAITYTSFNLDVRLQPAKQSIAVRALLTVRNDGGTPLAHIPLQISSSLTWERILLGGRDIPFQVSTLNSDADHTGQLHEAAMTLTTPLAPGATVQLDVTYSGTIPKNAHRLLAVGAPEDVALHSDWDAIGTDFTGLRGFGNVVWYPASSIPVILGDGARLFDEMGEHKLRLSGAQFRLHLTVEFPTGNAPTIVIINGRSCPLNTTAGNEEIDGIATAELTGTTLGFEAPSLFVAIRKAEPATNATLWTRPDDESFLPDWKQATTSVTPFLQSWLGQSPRSQLTILDLPEADDAPFETGSLLATPIHSTPQDALQDAMVHALAHAWLQSPRAWLNEGAAHFMGTLWLEKSEGRLKALESLESQRAALALAEPASPGTSPGQTLARAISPIYYRSKATYVLWMLRDLAGDSALAAAFHAYDPAADAALGFGPAAGAGTFEKLLKDSAQDRNLTWFFSDWIDADKGLPDLTIANVVSQAAQAGNTLVGITIANSGYAAAEVPVTVYTPDTAVTQRVLVPARGSVTPRILILGSPNKVQVNDGTVPEIQASVHVTTLGNTPSDGSSSSSQPGQPR